MEHQLEQQHAPEDQEAANQLQGNCHWPPAVGHGSGLLNVAWVDPGCVTQMMKNQEDLEFGRLKHDGNMMELLVTHKSWTFSMMKWFQKPFPGTCEF